MSMLHKAFPLDYEGFSEELEQPLIYALQTGDAERLVTVIQANIPLLRDPDEEVPLASTWLTTLRPFTVQHLGDIALTKYYRRSDDVGLDNAWQEPQELLETAITDGEMILLGRRIGPANNPFDPGEMGSYFQPPEQVRHNMEIVASIIRQRPGSGVVLEPVMSMLQRAIVLSKGLYITF